MRFTEIEEWLIRKFRLKCHGFLLERWLYVLELYRYEVVWPWCDGERLKVLSVHPRLSQKVRDLLDIKEGVFEERLV